MTKEAGRVRTFTQRELITVSREMICNDRISGNTVVSRRDFWVREGTGGIYDLPSSVVDR